MREPYEFPSPFVPRPPEDSPVAPPKPAVSTISPTNGYAAPPGRQAGGRKASLDRILAALAADPAFLRMIAALAALPPEKRADAVASWDFWWNYLAGIERGRVVKGYRDDLYDHEVAALAGIERETLGRDDGYKDFKRRLSARSPGAAKRRRVRGVLRRIDMAGMGDPDRHND